jgi:hypothetical protein
MGMRRSWQRRLTVAVSASVALAVPIAPAAHAADPSPSPTGGEVPQPSACAQYTSAAPSFVYAGQSATMTVSIRGMQDNANLTPVGIGADGTPITFAPGSATAAQGAGSDATTSVPFSFTPSDTSTVAINWTDHCAAEAAGQQDRQGSTSPSTVRVVHSAPPPDNYACGAPDMYAVAADRTHVVAGDAVHLTVTVRTLPCYGEERGPHYFTVVGRTPGQSTSPYEVIGEGQTDEHGHAELTTRPTRDIEYALHTTYGVKSVVTVDRTAGTCTGQVATSAPAGVVAGATARISGHAPAGYDVTLNLRRRGQTAFTPRPITVDSEGNWTTVIRADDDYRYYASTSLCDSRPGLLIVHPTIVGPAVAAKSAIVTLTIHAPAGAPVAVYFRRAGGAFTVRRTGRAAGDGRFLVTYRADRDYRYYAVTSADGRASSAGLTQVR